MSFSTNAWDQNFDLFEKMCALPFNQELASGQLSQTIFNGYLIQDSYYLIAFAKTLAIAAAKANNPIEIIQFSEAAQNAISEELKIHRHFFNRFGIADDSFSKIPISLACHHYSHFLMSTAFSAHYPIILAALLPCFCIYSEIGTYISKKSNKNNPYSVWIENYSGEKFKSSVRSITILVNKIAKNCQDSTLNAMHQTYTDSMKLEWIFWNSCYKSESWPI